jgi:hypothetical protein
MMKINRIPAALLLLFLGLVPLPANAQPEPVSRGPMLIEIATRVQPALAYAGGKSYLVYELHLTNFVPDRSMTIDALDVLGSGDAPLLSLDKSVIARNLRIIGARASKDEPTQLAAGQRAIVFLWVPAPKVLPHSLTHRVGLHIAGVERNYLIDSEPVTVSRRPSLVIRPPLEGGPWVTANGPNPAEVPAHNQLLYPERGIIHIPQRFATDWISLDPAGRIFAGPIDRNGSYKAYGARVLAVADGTVAAVHDGVAENTPPEVTVKLGQPDRAGNYVILDIGRGAYAFYGHLKPGGILVKPGQRVHSGQSIASIGNSGNSTGPHLHFHVTDGASLASEGLPFTFASYDDLGTLTVSLDDLEQGKPASVGEPSPRRADLPLGGRIVRFRLPQR